MSTAILEKVRKLRALATSANVHEAAAAAAAAERLIQEHNLSEAEIHVDAENERVDSGLGVEVTYKKIPTWANNLAENLATAYQCAGIWRGTVDGFRYTVFGRPDDIATFRYQFAFFSAEVTRLAEQASRGKGRTFGNCFRLGAVAAISEAIDNVRRKARAFATSTALVVVDRRAELAKERRAVECPGMRSSGGSSSRFDQRAFDQGKRAGAGISQRSALAPSGARLLGRGSA